MSIQILGGIAKGLNLKVPSSDLTRPTLILLRRKLFDAHQDLSGFHFIDLCAGTGAMGIEAWSRGADKVTFCEKNKKVYPILTDNLKLLKERFSEDVQSRPVESFAMDGIEYLKNYTSHSSQTIFFFDPPYEKHSLYEQILDFFITQKPESILWLESEDKKGVSFTQIEKKIPIYREYRQGLSFIVIIK